MQGDDVEGGDVEDDEVQGGDVEDDEVKDDDVVVDDDDDDVKGEEKDDVENHDVEEAEDDDTEDADVEEEDRSPDHASGFVRACAVDMHVHEWGTRDIRRATLYRNFSQKILRPKMGPERGHALCASLRSRNACQDFTKATLCGNL